MDIPRAAMVQTKEWAQERLRAGTEPPWSYYRLMQLIEAIDSLAASSDSVSPTGRLLQSGTQQDGSIPQGASIYQLDTSRSHRAEPPVQLPT